MHRFFLLRFCKHTTLDEWLLHDRQNSPYLQKKFFFSVSRFVVPLLSFHLILMCYRFNNDEKHRFIRTQYRNEHIKLTNKTELECWTEAELNWTEQATKQFVFTSTYFPSLFFCFHCSYFQWTEECDDSSYDACLTQVHICIMCLFAFWLELNYLDLKSFTFNIQWPRVLVRSCVSFLFLCLFFTLNQKEKSLRFNIKIWRIQCGCFVHTNTY